MQQLIDGPGVAVTRVCADDVGGALKTISALQLYHSIFALMEKFAGLSLMASSVEQLLESAVPQWKDFDVRAVAPYLGFQMGPNADNE
eukprot:5821623-Pyramimonas_sp.AAC.1